MLLMDKIAKKIVYNRIIGKYVHILLSCKSFLEAFLMVERSPHQLEALHGCAYTLLLRESLTR